MSIPVKGRELPPSLLWTARVAACFFLILGALVFVTFLETGEWWTLSIATAALGGALLFIFGLELPDLPAASWAQRTGWFLMGVALPDGLLVAYPFPSTHGGRRMLEQETIREREGRWKPRPTLSGSDYTSPEVWEEERERIWFGDWVCIGRAEEVATPGDYLVRDLVGESIFITRNAKGELHGFYNVCSHRGTKFLDDLPAKGNVRKAFVCPYHSWTYDLDGRLIGTPNVREDEHFDRGQFPLHGFPVDTYAGFLFANLAREPRPLLESLNDGVESVTVFDRFGMGDLRIGARIVYEVKANWKIIVENYNECLHCPVVHPELVQVVPLFRFGEVWDGETRDGGNEMMDGAKSFTMTGRSELPPLPGLLDEDMTRYYGAYQFPNLLLNIHPDCVMYYIGYPKGPGHTTVVSEYLFRPETIADPDVFKPEPVVELWDLISKQDWDVCERAQIGVGSRAFTTGVYPRQDRYLFAFNESYRVKMGREKLGRGPID